MSSIHSATDRIQVLEIIGNAITGGMENVVLRLVERLPPERFGVTALCPFESLFTSRLRDAGAEVLIAPMPLTGDPSWNAIQTACGIARVHSVDVIHAHMPNAHAIGGIAGRLVSKPVLATIHSRQLQTVDLEAHTSCGTHLNVVCQASYFHALAMGVQAAQLSVIGNGIDTDVYTAARQRQGVLRRRHGIAPEVPLIAFVGRFDYEKGPDLFVRAAHLALQQRSDLRFLLLGEGPMRPQIKEAIAAAGIGERVQLAGLVFDMPSAYAECDVLLSSSRSEAMPLALLEAMASGLPVVAPRVGGVPDLVAHGLTGYLVGEGDVDMMANEVIALVGDEPGILSPCAAALGAEGRLRAMRHFSLADSVGSTMALLTRLARPKSPTMRMVAGSLSDARPRAGHPPVGRQTGQGLSVTPPPLPPAIQSGKRTGR